jgi:hypothetical protein
MISFFWILLTPRWSFTIATNKTVYAIGEDVQITVTLKNTGYIPQTITSANPDPVVVKAESSGSLVWVSPRYFQIDQASFTIAPDQPLIRSFVWNQTWYYNQEGARSGRYYIMAIIPNANINEIGHILTGSDQQFHTYTEINITGT